MLNWLFKKDIKSQRDAVLKSEQSKYGTFVDKDYDEHGYLKTIHFSDIKWPKFVKNNGVCISVTYSNGRFIKRFNFFYVNSHGKYEFYSKEKNIKIKDEALDFAVKRKILDEQERDYRRANYQNKQYGKYWRNNYFIGVHLGIGGFRVNISGKRGVILITLVSIPMARIELLGPTYEDFMDSYFIARQASINYCSVPTHQISVPIPSKAEFNKWIELAKTKKPL